MKLKCLWFVSLALLGASCTHMISADAVDGTLRRVADRHDAYVQADPQLSDLERRADLRDTQLLRQALDTAEGKAPATQPTTQP